MIIIIIIIIDIIITTTILLIPVNSLSEGHLWDRQEVSVLERCLSYRESNKGSKERQGPTLGVRFTEVSVL